MVEGWRIIVGGCRLVAAVVGRLTPLLVAAVVGRLTNNNHHSKLFVARTNRVEHKI